MALINLERFTWNNIPPIIYLPKLKVLNWQFSIRMFGCVFRFTLTGIFMSIPIVKIKVSGTIAFKIFFTAFFKLFFFIVFVLLFINIVFYVADLFGLDYEKNLKIFNQLLVYIKMNFLFPFHQLYYNRIQKFVKRNAIFFKIGNNYLILKPISLKPFSNRFNNYMKTKTKTFYRFLDIF